MVLSLRFNHGSRVFRSIRDKFEEMISDISFLKTEGGNTQTSERKSIEVIKSVLDGLGLKYSEAGSQQSKDFRSVYKNVKSLGINIEIKKTNGLTVYFNDTLPTEDIYYIIFVMGKEYKVKDNILPQVIFINGSDLIGPDKTLLREYQEDINYLKDKWGRKKCFGKANEFTNFSVYPRPTYKTNITHLLNTPRSFVLEVGGQHFQSE
jgi:hypothetical protein